MDIGIVGQGRLGTSLKALLEARFQRVAWVARGERSRADVVLLAVPDRAVAEAAAALPSGPVVLHCSGTLPADAALPHNERGSFHPLMTFPGPDQLPALDGVPAAIDGTPRAIEAASALAELLGMRTVRIPGDRRLYHAAAVIAGNFATVLLADAARALHAAGVAEADAAGLLAPLALQSIRNAVPDPAVALTGPAARADEATLARHRDALHDAGLDDLLELYDALSKRARALATRAER